MVKTSYLNKVEDNVREMLRTNEHYRNCDICLILQYWFLHDGVSDKDIYDINVRHSLTSTESVRRCRQKVQSEVWTDKDGIRRYGRYLPTDPLVRKRRGIAEDVYREYSRQ